MNLLTPSAFAIAAMSMSMSGSTRFGFLDPRHVLIGAGPAFTLAEKDALITELAATGRHPIYGKYSYVNG